MTEIVPAFLVQSEKEFEHNLRLVENDCKLIQVDVLDGSLFPNTCWFDAKRVGALKTNVEMELHLMVENPLPIIEAWKKHVPTFKRAIVHAEMHRPEGVITGFISDELKLEAGIALNPESPLSEAKESQKTIKQVTIMSVHPGFQGQSFGDPQHGGDKDSILKKVTRAKKEFPNATIEIDGGITEELIEPLVRAGADRLCIGSAIFKTEDPTKTLQSFNNLVKNL